MIVAIHQPHYFPWLGYLDKIAKADIFILMDDVQLTDKSNMFRNKFLAKNGKEKYLTVCFQKKGYMQMPFNQVKLNDTVKWQRDHINFLRDTYRKAPYFTEIWTLIEPILTKKYELICDVDIDTISLLCRVFNIKTKIIKQRNLVYDKESKKSELVLSLCKSVNAGVYFSGNGARKYMDMELFKKNNIDVIYQKFQYPYYKQINTDTFIPNLSSLDFLFNCGIDKANQMFWDNVEKNT